MIQLRQRTGTLNRLKNVSDDAVYICFQSCNYDTEIFQYKEKILITTCRNETWDSAMDNLREKYGVEIRAKGEDCNEIYENEYNWDYSSDKKNKYCLHFDREKIEEELGPAHIIDKLIEYGENNED